MKKLFWSAFAMSLCLNSFSAWSQTEAIDDFIGMETEILPALEGPQKFSPKDLHQKKEWNIQEKQVEIESAPLKGQGHSLIPWSDQDPEEWLSIDKWLITRSLKDKVVDWKFRLRDERQHEHMGKVLQCHGVCEVYRGTMKAKVTHLSRIDEGDELKTSADSVAWVFLMDGTLVRIGPESSVSFQEINWSKKEVFHLVRLNQGHIYWHPRDNKEVAVNLSPETDAISLPLMVREANLEFFERGLFKSQNDFQRSNEVLKVEETAIANQVKALNEMKVSNNASLHPETRLMLVAPNGTIVSKLTSFDFFHYPGGKSHFKKRHSAEGFDLTLSLRGYNTTETTSITDDTWFEIDVNGKEYTKVAETSGGLEITDLLTRRIKTLELAREIWLKTYTMPVVASLDDPKNLALNHGYKLWGDEHAQRFNFLVEYTRRMETTNLKSMDNLLKKIETSGEAVQKEMGDGHYKAALNYYLRDLKVRYTNSKMQVREMSDLQYYIWILRHGKTQN